MDSNYIRYKQSSEIIPDCKRKCLDTTGTSTTNISAFSRSGLSRRPIQPSFAPKTKNLKPSSPLYMACLNSHSDIKIVKICLDRGEHVDIHDPRTKNTPLIAACKNGHIDIVKLVLSKGAKVNLQNKIGWTALTVASECGHGEVVKLLVDKHAELDMQDDEGMTALMIVSLSGRSDIVELLIKKGANVNIQDNNGLSALMKASLNGHIHTVNLLIEKGAYIDMQDKQGRSALMIAFFHGHLRVAKLLIENHADTDLQDILGRKMLDIALAQGNEETLYTLYPVEEQEEMGSNEAIVHAESSGISPTSCGNNESNSLATDNHDSSKHTIVDVSSKPDCRGKQHEQRTELADSSNVHQLSKSALLKEMAVLTDPIQLGCGLGIKKHVLEIIENENKQDIRKQKIALFSYMEDNYKVLGITWSRIATVLEDMHKGNLAHDIREKFNCHPDDKERSSQLTDPAMKISV